MRRLVPLVALGAVGLSAAACGGSSSGSSAPTSAPVTTTVTAAPTTSGPYTPPVLPTPSSSGALKLVPVGTIPGPAQATGTQAVVAEAPDGTVFVAAGGSSVAYVVDGTRAPAVAEHADAAVLGLAADATHLYVATTKDVTRYDRTSGLAQQTYPVVVAPNRLPQLQVGGTTVWVLTSGGSLDTIDPASAATRTVTSLGAADAYAVDGTGAYWVTPDGKTLEHVTTGGEVTSVPTGLSPSAELSGSNAVHAQAVSGPTLVLAFDAGQGLDASLITYAASGLTKLASAATDVSGASVVPTLAGPLVYANGSSTFCGSGACVARTVLATATATSVAAMPGGQYVVGLAGPYPVVVTASASSTGLAVSRLE